MLLPDGFVEVTHPQLWVDLHYATTENFSGKVVAGYRANKLILTKPAADALIDVQKALNALNPSYRLHIFDAYRPVMAVKDFVTWSKLPEDGKTKALYYPDFAKPQLFEQGYIAEQSSHSRGSTVDLTIAECDAKACHDLDMGTHFDFFGPRSHTDYGNLTLEQQKNRQLLVEVMQSHGFINYPMEWWHFTLADEPYPRREFDFAIE